MTTTSERASSQRTTTGGGWLNRIAKGTAEIYLSDDDDSGKPRPKLTNRMTRIARDMLRHYDADDPQWLAMRDIALRIGSTSTLVRAPLCEMRAAGWVETGEHRGVVMFRLTAEGAAELTAELGERAAAPAFYAINESRVDELIELLDQTLPRWDELSPHGDAEATAREIVRVMREKRWLT